LLHKWLHLLIFPSIGSRLLHNRRLKRLNR
jgi:hypothetical protein